MRIILPERGHAETILFAGVFFTLATANSAVAETQPQMLTTAQLLNMPLEDLGRLQVTTPSGTPAPIEKAAAVVTVITADDIQAMGVNDLMSALRSVPGMHIGRSEQGDTRRPMIRGITSTFTPQTLFLLNGIPLTVNVTGNRSNVISNVPLRAVERIEIIRGPGSALYGADAYAGIVNVITKTPDTMAGRKQSTTVAGFLAGSVETRGAWLQSAQTKADIKTSLSLEYESTDGYNGWIGRDAQTSLDELMQTANSLAPGKMNNSVNEGQARLELKSDHWRFRAGYQERADVGTGAGINLALDPHGYMGGYRFNADYSYFTQALQDSLSIENRISFLRTVQRITENLWLYPPGTFMGAFPEGLIGNPGYKEDNARYDLSAVYRGIDQHLVRFGAGFNWGDLWETTESKNFTFGDNGIPQPLPSVEDFSDTDVTYIPEKQRTSHYALLQDEWAMARNWQLTAGVRTDQYSDFGNTTNPRLALVWETTPVLTTKLLVGRAFRAPSFAEMYVRSPVYAGNPDLKPETLDNWETVFALQPNAHWIYSLSFFRYRIHDFISTVARPGLIGQFENVGKRTGTGGEAELTWTPSCTVTWLANYSYQRSIDNKTDTAVGEYPLHQIYTRLDLQLNHDWKLSPQVNYVGSQKRILDDPRAPVQAYTTLDITLRKHWRSPDMDAAVTLSNAFDADVREPSPYGVPTTSIPGDFPMPGRAVRAEASYRF